MLCADEILARTDELQKFKTQSSTSAEAKQSTSV